MKIVADAGILAVEKHFTDMGELQLVPGREIRRAQLLDADALLVRSITRVDAELLRGTKVRFVGTATSGTDHIDLDYLHERQIAFSHTQGSNANAVVDYCFAALAHVQLSGRRAVPPSTFGLIGAGHVGGRFAARLEALGWEYQVCDPQLELQLRSGGRDAVPATCPPLARFVTLDTLLQNDVISLHVPLTDTGANATRNLLNSERLARIRADALIINTCRGAVVNELALREKIRLAHQLCCIVDVWENEPDIATDLVVAVEIATPHIAGYSENAKLAATTMLAQRLREFMGYNPGVERAAVARMEAGLSTPLSSDSHWQLLLELLPLRNIDAQFKAYARQGVLPAQFDRMRGALQSRREFCDYRISGAGLSESQQDFLTAMGIQVDHARR